MKYAIITGGSSGLGREIATSLSDVPNLKILIIGRDEIRLQETCAFHPDKIELLCADLATLEGRETVRKALSLNIKITYLVHSASIIESSALKDVTLEDWRQQIAINLEAPLFLTQILLPYMEKGCRILNISSGFTRKPTQGVGVYCVTKAVLNMLSDCLKTELEKSKILVNYLGPGAIDTPMQEKVRSFTQDIFPSVTVFRTLKIQNKLRSAEVVAQFVKWVLMKTDDKQFSIKDWNINDEQDKKYWLVDEKKNAT